MRPEQAKGVVQTPETNLIERAEVISIGDQVQHIRPRDKVLFTSFGVDSVDIDGVRNYFLLEDDAFILAIERVEEEPMYRPMAPSLSTHPTMVTYAGGDMSDMSSASYVPDQERPR